MNMVSNNFLGIYFLIFGYVCLVSCNNKRNEQSNSGLFDTSASENYYYTDIENHIMDTVLFNQPKVVYLETTLNSLISRINKVNIDDSVLFILDTKLSKILKFNENGRFIADLYRKGEGPMEYRGIIDFTTDTDKKELFVLCEFPYKIYVYNYDFEFIREIKTTDLYLELALYNDKIFCRKAPLHNNKIKGFHIDILDRTTGEIKNSVLPILTQNELDYHNIKLNSGSLLTNHKEPMIAVPDRNFLYSLKKESITYPMYTISERSQDDTKGVYNFTETDKYIIFSISNLLSVIDKKSGILNGYKYGIFNTSLLNATVNRLIPSNVPNGIVLGIYPIYIKEVEKKMIAYRKENPDKDAVNETFLNFAKRLKIEDNPVLLIYKTK